MHEDLDLEMPDWLKNSQNEKGEPIETSSDEVPPWVENLFKEEKPTAVGPETLIFSINLKNPKAILESLKEIMETITDENQDEYLRLAAMNLGQLFNEMAENDGEAYFNVGFYNQDIKLAINTYKDRPAEVTIYFSPDIEKEKKDLFKSRWTGQTADLQ